MNGRPGVIVWSSEKYAEDGEAEATSKSHMGLFDPWTQWLWPSELSDLSMVSLTHELKLFDPVNSMTSYQGGQECDIPLELLYKVLI